MMTPSGARPPRFLRASWHRVRHVLQPPPPLTISEWADKHRVLGPSSVPTRRRS
jgi:hypothetical protein